MADAQDTPDESAIADDVRALIESNLTDVDVRYKRVLRALSPVQLQVCATFFVQVAAFGTLPKDEALMDGIKAMSGPSAHAARMAIMTAYGFNPHLVRLTEEMSARAQNGDE